MEIVPAGAAERSFALLGPGAADVMARVGVEAGTPIMRQISDLTGFPEVFANMDVITVLFLAWLVLIVAASAFSPRTSRLLPWILVWPNAAPCLACSPASPACSGSAAKSPA